MDKTSFKIFITALVLSIIIFMGLLLLTRHIDNNQEVKLEYVTSPNIFYTVENCVNKYIQLIQSNNREAVYNLIDEKYKEEHKITIYNAIANNDAIEEYSTFVAQKILEDKNNKNTYYVKGFLEGPINIDEDYTGKRTAYSLIVKLNFSNYTYSIIPERVGALIDEI